jgi:hypothetical protein
VIKSSEVSGTGYARCKPMISTELLRRSSWNFCMRMISSTVVGLEILVLCGVSSAVRSRHRASCWAGKPSRLNLYSTIITRTVSTQPYVGMLSSKAGHLDDKSPSAIIFYRLTCHHDGVDYETKSSYTVVTFKVVALAMTLITGKHKCTPAYLQVDSCIHICR